MFSVILPFGFSVTTDPPKILAPPPPPCQAINNERCLRLIGSPASLLAKNPWNSHTLPFPSAMLMWLQSYVSTTTLQKGGGKKEGNFPKRFKVFVKDCKFAAAPFSFSNHVQDCSFRTNYFLKCTTIDRLSKSWTKVLSASLPWHY